MPWCYRARIFFARLLVAIDQERGHRLVACSDGHRCEPDRRDRVCGPDRSAYGSHSLWSNASNVVAAGVYDGSDAHDVSGCRESTLFAPMEIPIGIITALIGAIFIALLRRTGC